MTKKGGKSLISIPKWTKKILKMKEMPTILADGGISFRWAYRTTACVSGQVISVCLYIS